MSQSEPDYRLLYLQQLGIDVWQLRQPAAAQADADAEIVEPLDWGTLAGTVDACRRCPLGEKRAQAVLGVGDPAARIVVIGLAPAADEDRSAKPFAGVAEQLLYRMLAAIGVSQEQVYQTTLVKCGSVEEHGPQALEMASCAPYLQQQLDLIRPALVLAVGEPVAQQLLATQQALTGVRGRTHQYGEQEIPLVATYAPDDLLRSPRDKAHAWEDLKLVRDVLEGD